LKIPWTTTDGANLKELTQTPGSSSKRFKLCRRGWSGRQKKSSRKTLSSRKRINSMQSARLWWLANLVPKLQNNCQSISRTSRRKQTKWKLWQLSSTCTRPRSTSTSMRLSGLPANSRTWSASTSRRREENRWREMLLVSNQQRSTLTLGLTNDSLVEDLIWLSEK
jgi:hypothetical protein